MFLCAIFIFVYGKIRCHFKLLIWDLDGLSLSHFFFFIFLGYQCPDYF